MDMQEPEIDYEEEEYESSYNSIEPDAFAELLLAPTHDRLIDIIVKLKNDSDKFSAFVIQLKEQIFAKKKDSCHLKKLETKILGLLENLQVNARYAETDQQIAILWFFDKFCLNQKIMLTSQSTRDSLTKIFQNFTHFADFPAIINLVTNISSNSTRHKLITYPFNETLKDLFNENYEKIESGTNQIKFVETMKTLSEENKLVVKVGILNFFVNDNSRWKIQESEINKILALLSQKPYENLFKYLIEKKFKSVKQLRSAVLKSKIQVTNDKIELAFSAKCELCKELKTLQNFELAAKNADGSELIPQFDADSIIPHGDYIFTKWSADILTLAKEKVSYDSSEEQLNEGFLKLLAFLKKLFENRHKQIVQLGEQPKIVQEEGSKSDVPQETAEYICKIMQLFVRFLSFNSLEINHRSNNLSELIPVTFLDELFTFFETCLKKYKILNEGEPKMQKKEKEEKKPQKNIFEETIDYIITFAAHLFYRRDFQTITSLNVKTSQIIVRILLLVEKFPIKWNVLRNYKLVIDRWGDSVTEKNQEYEKLAKKFLESYFSDKVIVYSKSSSTVFNPMFASKLYCKIFGSEFLKFTEIFEKQLEDQDAKNPQSIVSRQMNLKMSKMILFMSARIRFQEVNKIAEILGRIYRKYAHIIPEIYLFRSWITQICLFKQPQQEIGAKLSECREVAHNLMKVVADLPGKKLLTDLSKQTEEENAEVLKLINLYKSTHYRALNSLQVKVKGEEFGSAIYNLIWEIIKEHIELEWTIKEKVKLFEKDHKEEFDAIEEENDLLLSQKIGSIQSIVHDLRHNLLCLVRYYICNSEKLLSVKDHSALIGVVGVWIKDFVTKANESKEKFNFNIKNLYVIVATNLPAHQKNHFFKKQILGAMRILASNEQFVMNRDGPIPFNEVSSLYEQIKPVYIKFIKLLLKIEAPDENKPTKDKTEVKLHQMVCKQVIQYILVPHTNVFGPCNFNGKIEDKGTEDMALGLFLEQAESIFKNFSVQEILDLESQYPLGTMLQITKNKGELITEEKVLRAPGRNIFAQNPRANRDRNEAMNELRQINIPEDYIQIALENIDVPDPQLALEWIQNNQDRMETLIMERVIRMSKQENMGMKQIVEPKLEVGKIAPIRYPQFIEKFEKAMKELVKNFAKDLFSENGKRISKVLFVILDAFKDDFRKKQYVNLCNKMFTEINSLHANENFDDKKYRLSLRILNFTMKKEPEMFKEYYKEGICLKVLSFVRSFANSLKDEEIKSKERKEDFYQLLEIANKALPEWKSTETEIKPELVMYFDCLLNVIHLANLGGRDVWEILYKIASLQNKDLIQKISKIFSHIVIDKSILEEEKRHHDEDEYNRYKSNNIFSKQIVKPLAIKVCMLPLAKILLEQDSQLLLANIELEIKGYIAENYKYNIFEIVSGKEKNPILEIDIRTFLTSFGKFENCKEFASVFKKLFSKKKNKKNIFYDTSKHSFSESEFACSVQTPFISVKYSPTVDEIVKTMITRPVLNETDRELQEEALIELYKFLDYFKVLVPTALKIEWWSETDNKKINLLEWLICKSVASNKKKYQFMAFLAMNNHLFASNDNTSISEYACSEYLKIFKGEFSLFRTYIDSKKEQANFKEESLEEKRFKKVFFNFLYLLQVDKFNAQCFLKVNGEPAMRETIEEIFINLDPNSLPIIYTLVNESIFILRKREMIDLLKSKYELVSHQQISQITNNNLTQFLNMGMIYKVEPKSLQEKMTKSRLIRRGGYNSNSRLVVDEVDDEQNEGAGEDLDEDEMYHESISHLLGARAQGQLSQRVQANDEAYLVPLEILDQNSPVPNQEQKQGEQKLPEESEKIQQEPKIDAEVEKISQADYQQILKQRSEKQSETLLAIEKLLPSLKSLTHESLSTEKVQIEEEKMGSQSDKKPETSIFNFDKALSELISKAPKNMSQVLPANSKFEPNAEIKPQFVSRLILNDGIEKLVKFQRRFKSLITSLYPQIKSNIWQNDYSTSSSGPRSMLEDEGRELLTARNILQRLERQENIGNGNRDEILIHIERLMNQRQEPRQQGFRPRPLNLNRALEELPEQVEPPKVQEKPKNQQKEPENKIQQEVANKVVDLPIEEKIVDEKIVQEKVETQKIVEEKVQEPKQQSKEEKMEEEKPAVFEEKKEEKIEEKVQEAQNQMISEPSNANLQPAEQVPQRIIEEAVVNQQQEIEAPPEFEMEVMQQGPYREILAMFGLSQTFLADNGIDPESFDCLPEELQIDQITHYMNQAQNRNAINQLNQANRQPAQQQNAQQPAQNQEGEQAQQPQQPRNNVNEVLQENIALFASMDPEIRMEMLADYPPEFLMQLPVQMRTEVQQYRQRQLHRIVEADEEDMRGLRQDHYGMGGAKKAKSQKPKENVKYPSPKELDFNPVSESLAEHLSKGIFLKVEKSRVLEGFRLLLENYLTQEAAIATIVGLLKEEEKYRLTQIEYKRDQKEKKPEQKKEVNEPAEKGYWKYESRSQLDSAEINSVKESLLNLVLETMNNSIYKNEDFLVKKIPFKNFLNIKIQPSTELQADENGFWPLYELLPFSLNHCPKLSVEILKRVKEIPLRLIKEIVRAIRNDKLTPQIYKNLEFLSKNPDMKTLFMEEFPESKPLKLDIFAKIIKYEFARVPYLRKLHEQALSYYSAEYNEFLNQIFGIYTAEDIKEIESLLMKHKNIHFQVIKFLYSQNRVLDKEPMGIILKMPHLLDFETKKYIFRKHPKIRRASRYRLPIEVSRGNILQESYNQIMSKTPKELEGRLQITFMEEQGYDAGGLTREWLMCLSRQIFRPDYALFEPSSSGNTYQPNPKSFVNPDHLQYFKFIGRFVGKALAQNQLVDAYFTRAFYKMILGQDIELSDLEQQDYAFYKSMLWLKQNPIEKGDYTFSYLYDNFGQRIVKDLIADGRNIDVTQENKAEYIEKYCLAKMRDDFKAQMEKFLEGFHEMIPPECISFFEAKELELLISGLPEIDFEDLRKNVDYSGFAPTDQAVKWFWEIIEEFSQEDLARLIQFITGTSKIPVDGFANIKGMNGPQRISIHKDPNPHQLPKAHTCFNQLDLPEYDTKEIMRERIVTAITWGSEGFGFM